LDLLEPRELADLRDRQACRAHLVQQVLRVYRDLVALKDLPDQVEALEQQDHQDLRDR